MAKVITFSKVFPGYHPRAGEPTFFVEKIWSGLLQIDRDLYTDYLTGEARPDYMKHYSHYEPFDPKFHTIRLGNRFNPGDKFSPRMWSGKPYNSKQIIIAPEIEIKKVWDFKIKEYTNGWYIDFGSYAIAYGYEQFSVLETLAKNDGLSRQDLMDWFKYPSGFNGQIICWNDKINY